MIIHLSKRLSDPMHIGIVCVLSIIFSTSCDNRELHPAPVVPPPPAPAASAKPFAADRQAIYELREKCGRDAQQWYKHFYEDSGVNPKASTISATYTAHYSESLNKCFAETITWSLIKDQKSRKQQTVESRSLADVLENRDVGTFFFQMSSLKPFACSVADGFCSSRDEWTKLIAQYMER